MDEQFKAIDKLGLVRREKLPRKSKLDKYRAGICMARTKGHPWRKIQTWLLEIHGMPASHTTIMRRYKRWMQEDELNHAPFW